MNAKEDTHGIHYAYRGENTAIPTVKESAVKKKIIYIRGDATSPMSKGIKIIAHICNDLNPGGARRVLLSANAALLTYSVKPGGRESGGISGGGASP
jgi:hypothetical protein